MKLSLVFSIFFCVYSIKLLLEERFEPIYQYEYENITKESFDFRFCIDLKEIISNQTELIYLPNLKADLMSYFNTTEFHRRFSNDWHLLGWFMNQRMEAKDLFVYKNQICLPFIFNEVRNKNFYKKILATFNAKTMHYYLYDNETFSIINVRNINYIYSTKVDRLAVLKSHPYKDCKPTELNGEKYLSTSCLNNCFKNKLKIGKYFYNLNEDTTIMLDYDANNETIVQNEQDCLANCREKDCRLDRFLFNQVLSSFKTSRISYYIGRALIPDLDYYIQFVGLILLFINISFYQIFSKTFEFIFIKIKKSTKMILIFELNLVLMFLVVIIVLLINFVNTYQDNKVNPIKKQLMTRLIVPESFDYLICLEKILSIENKTLTSLEKETNGMINDAVKDVYYQFDNQRQEIAWKFTNKIYFTFDYGYVERCFSIHLEPQEFISHYRNLLSIPKLTIELKKIERNKDNLMYSNFYILPDNQNFNSKSYEHLNNVNFMKNKIKRSAKDDKCASFRYSPKLKRNFNCTGQYDCTQKCLLRAQFKQNSKIVPYKVYDYFLISDTLKSKHIAGFTEKIDDGIEKKCRKRFEKKDCEVNFFESKFFSIGNVDEFRREVDLYYDVIETIEEEPSKNKIVLDLLNVQSILFGLNAMNLSLKISGILNLKFNFKIKNHFIVHFILCAVGFCVHSYLIFKEIINSELIKSQHYEMQDQIDPPDIVFCIAYNQTFNEELSYSDLDKITKYLSSERMFDKIEYLDKTNKWISVDQSLNFSDSHFHIDTFYFLDKKCFKLSLNLIYERTQFIFEDNEQILRISFNSKFTDDQKLLFFTKRKNKLHLSRMNYFWPGSEVWQVDEETFKVAHFDRYNQIKNFFENPLSLFYTSYLNDADKYMNMLIDAFKKDTNFTTLNLPLEDVKNNLKINNDEFEIYVRDVQNVKDQDIPSNSNFEREFTAHHLDVTKVRGLRDRKNETFDFAFKLKSSFFTVFILETNADNWAKLLLNLLSSISFWLGVNPVSFFALKTNLLGKTISKYAFKSKKDVAKNEEEVLELKNGNKDDSENESKDEIKYEVGDKPLNAKIISHLIKDKYQQSIEDRKESIKFKDREAYESRRTRNLNLLRSQSSVSF